MNQKRGAKAWFTNFGIYYFLDWEKVDHSVLLVGWGEENEEKYWQI